VSALFHGPQDALLNRRKCLVKGIAAELKVEAKPRFENSERGWRATGKKTSFRERPPESTSEHRRQSSRFAAFDTFAKSQHRPINSVADGFRNPLVADPQANQFGTIAATASGAVADSAAFGIEDVILHYLRGYDALSLGRAARRAVSGRWR